MWSVIGVQAGVVVTKKAFETGLGLLHNAIAQRYRSSEEYTRCMVSGVTSCFYTAVQMKRCL